MAYRNKHNYNYNKGKTFKDKTDYSRGLETKPSKSAVEEGYVSKENNDKITGEQMVFSTSYKNLREMGSRNIYLTVHTDPKDLGAKISTALPILCRPNKPEDVKYLGDDNFGGDEIAGYINSRTSKLLKAPDYLTASLHANYLYYDPRLNSSNKRAYEQLVESNKEASSFMYSTQFINLPFFTLRFSRMDKTKKKGDNYTMDSDAEHGRFDVLMEYQKFQQNLAIVLNKYYNLRKNEQTMIDRAYNRESSRVIEFFGQLKKAAVISIFKAMSDSVLGEYFDTDWYNQVSLMYGLPSCKSNSIEDPIITTKIVYEDYDWGVFTPIVDKPNEFKLLYKFTDDFETNKLKTKYYDMESAQIKDQDTNSFSQVCSNFISLLDMSSIASMTRNPDIDVNELINAIKVNSNAVMRYITSFKTSVADIRTFLDRAQAANYIYWQKAVSWDGIGDRPTPHQMTRILLIEDLIKNLLCCDRTFDWDQNLQRFKYRVIWNKEIGIPGYDTKNGGAFLTLPCRDLSNYTDSNLPLLFKPFTNSNSFKVYALCRDGYFMNLNLEELNGNAFSENIVLSRLDVLGTFGNSKFIIPTIDLSKLSGDDLAARTSLVSKMLLRLFGMGSIKTGTDKINYYLSDDIYSLVTIQLADLSSQAIEFARTYCPFRVVNNTKERPYGFSVVHHTLPVKKGSI